MITSRIAYLSGAAAVVVIFAAGCGKHQSSQTTSEPTPPPQVAAEPGPPNLENQLGQLGAVQANAGWVVALPSAQFKAGQTRFEPADATRIDGIAQLLKDRPHLHVLVQAFTDSRGSSSRNKTLSQQRADAVQQALIERGVDATRIRSQGRGDAQPIASNDTASGREQNRRVEIVFSDEEGRFASTDEPPSTG